MLNLPIKFCFEFQLRLYCYRAPSRHRLASARSKSFSATLPTFPMPLSIYLPSRSHLQRLYCHLYHCYARLVVAGRRSTARPHRAHMRNASVSIRQSYASKIHTCPVHLSTNNGSQKQGFPNSLQKPNRMLFVCALKHLDAAILF